MNLNDYTPPTPDFATEHAPRERASQDTAREHRARTNDERRTTARPALRISPRIIIAGVMLPLLAALAFLWPSRPLPAQSAPTPTHAPALAAPTPAPDPAPTGAPTAAPAPTQPATAHVDSAPPTGRGLTIEEAAPAVEPSYLDTVAAQAPHSPRGGLCGPQSGDCAPNPTAPPEMLEIIRKQAPHEVR